MSTELVQGKLLPMNYFPVNHPPLTTEEIKRVYFGDDVLVLSFNLVIIIA